MLGGSLAPNKQHFVDFFQRNLTPLNKTNALFVS